MRVIAGYLGGRQFESPRGHRTHPMSEKMRGALFNMLGDLKGLTVVDAFAGSGALSFEAVSRGARSVSALDIDKGAFKTIQENIKSLGLEDRITAHRINAGSWSNRNRDKQYDLILCDPPYDGLQGAPVEKLARHVKPGGTYVLSWPPDQFLPRFPELEQVAQKFYGDSQLVFYKAR
jgi:16S rRNA (guanine966-N2)-methyltransferase